MTLTKQFKNAFFQNYPNYFKEFGFNFSLHNQLRGEYLDENITPLIDKLESNWIPHTAIESLSDWENVCGITNGETLTEEHRQQQILSIICAIPKLTRDAWETTARNLGYTPGVDIFFEETFLSTVVVTGSGVSDDEVLLDRLNKIKAAGVILRTSTIIETINIEQTMSVPDFDTEILTIGADFDTEENIED